MCFCICVEAPVWQNVTVPCFSAPSVVRSGDYYLFETDSEEEEEEEEKKEDDPQKKSAFQVTAGFQTSVRFCHYFSSFRGAEENFST